LKEGHQKKGIYKRRAKYIKKGDHNEEYKRMVEYIREAGEKHTGRTIKR